MYSHLLNMSPKTINKRTNKSSLMDLAGILSNEEADELRKNIKESRKEINKRIRKELDKTAKELQ